MLRALSRPRLCPLWLSLLLSACAGSHSLGPRGAAAAPGCARPDGELIPSDAALSAVMREAINPTLSRIALLLFHDTRPAEDESRTSELSRRAETLSRCFATLPRPARINAQREDFSLLASLQAHNAHALADAVEQRDRDAQMHWYQHIKETCQSCHNQYRPTQVE